MEKVALIKCDEYADDLVKNAVEKAFDLLGGLAEFVKAGQVVAVKANLLMKATPEKMATTHPAVVKAVVQKIMELNATPIIVDSAGGPFNSAYMNGIYKASGMADIAESTGCKLNQCFEGVDIECPNASIGKKFTVLKTLEDADVIINMCKFKTHSFTGYTNAVKNMFGAIPGLTKVEMHGKYKTLDVFTDFLYDIHEYFGNKLVLNVCDAVIGMEGPGPSNGTPKKIGAIIAGKNAVAVDVVACKLTNLDLKLMPIIQTGIKRGYLKNIDEVEVVGDKLEEMIVYDFKGVVPNNFKPFATIIPKFLQPTVHKIMTQRPVVPKRKCRGCQKCFEHCPVKAITMVERGNKKVAIIDYTKCIRCFCCQELCPFGVVKVKSGLIYRMVNHKRLKAERQSRKNKNQKND